jgi:hypothetical protein
MVSKRKTHDDVLAIIYPSTDTEMRKIREQLQVEAAWENLNAVSF